MSEPDDGGPAFPNADALGGPPAHTLGMSLRDYFAAQAIAPSMLACEQVVMAPESPEMKAEAVGIICYCIADAVLKARKA